MKRQNRISKPLFQITLSQKDEGSVFKIYLEQQQKKWDINKSLSGFNQTLFLSCDKLTKFKYYDETNILVLIDGEIYNNYSEHSEIEYIYKNYLGTGVDYIKDINGSYSLCIADFNRDLFYFIVDRINSKKLFRYRDAKKIIVSNSIYSFKNLNLTPDPTSIAWYLSNGAVFNNRTLFKEIKTVDRATITEISPKDTIKNVYWKYCFNNEYSNYTENDLMEELNSLLVKSIEKRVNSEREVSIALSGGYDSSTILGILKYRFEIENLNTFSYSFGDTSDRSDAYVAKSMAENCGYEFTNTVAFNGDIISFLRDNAFYGQGIANICDEIHAIQKISKKATHCDENTMFFGDECFGWVDETLKTKEEALTALKIFKFNNLDLLESILPHSKFSLLKNKLFKDYDNIVDGIPEFKDHFDTKNYIYLDQRISHVMTSWRDMFYSGYATIQNPFLDNDILDFMQKLHKKQRINKSLFKKTVSKFYPDIFKYKRAKIANNVPGKVYSKLFDENMQKMDSWLNEENPLDIFIPVNSIKKLLTYQEANRLIYIDKSKKVIKKLSRKSRYLKNTCDLFWGNLEQTDKVTLLKRIFVMRLFYKQFNRL